MPGHVFVSHAQADRNYADALIKLLRREAVPVWSDDGIDLGQNFARETEAAIREAGVVVVLMSPEADVSGWVRREVRLAIDLGKAITPLLLAGAPFADLRDLTHVDVTSGNLPGPNFLVRLRELTERPSDPLPMNVPGLVDPTATKVFISYRRSDGAFAAHWLRRELADWFERDGHLPRDSFFIDVDSIYPGRRFRDAVQSAIQQCQALLVLIGDRWLTAESDGLRRLDAPNDMVRQEIEIGLEHGVTIVPVLLAPAAMPDQRLLPQSIRDLPEFQGLTIRPERFREGVDFLAPRLRRIIGG